MQIMRERLGFVQMKDIKASWFRSSISQLVSVWLTTKKKNLTEDSYKSHNPHFPSKVFCSTMTIWLATPICWRLVLLLMSSKIF